MLTNKTDNKRNSINLIKHTTRYKSNVNKNARQTYRAMHAQPNLCGGWACGSWKDFYLRQN